jgi:hypothetical protein
MNRRALVAKCSAERERREGRDPRALGQSLQHDIVERVGAAGEDENIGGGVKGRALSNAISRRRNRFSESASATPREPTRKGCGKVWNK